MLKSLKNMRMSMWLELNGEDHAQSEVQKASQRALGRVCKDTALI